MRLFRSGANFADDVWEQDLPCFVNIVKTAGSHSKKGSGFVVLAAKVRYCQDCDGFLNMLDRPYSTHVFPDVLLQLQTKCAPVFTNDGTTEQCAEWSRNEDVDQTQSSS